MATRISDMSELTASINNSSNVFSFVDNTESNSSDQNKKISFNNFLKFFVENFDENPANDLSVSSNSQIFPASDTSTTTKVKVYRNLYINSGVTVTPNASCYGIIFICTGDFRNDGIISMIGKGLYGSGSGAPYNTINTLYGWQLPLDNPVAKKANNFRFAKSGSIWTNLISPPSKYSLPVFGTCGGGGFGGGNTYKPGGGGAAGTMFGAGGGGGGAGFGFSPNPATPKGNAGSPAVGIAGGSGGNADPIYSGDEGGGGGGAGSPAGSGGSSGPLTSPFGQSTAGENLAPAGSMCFIVKGNFANYGTIISVGGSGGRGGGAGGGGGGGSGGGSITIIYGGSYYGGTLSYYGGSGGSSGSPAGASGANGSSGGFSATNINFI